MDYTITIRMVEETTMAKGGWMESGQKLIMAGITLGMIWVIVSDRRGRI